MKQKIISDFKFADFEHQLKMALEFGWLVHSVTVNSSSNTWLAIMYRVEE